MTEHDVAHHGSEDGIAQELQPFVVEPAAFFFDGRRLVVQRLFVVLDVSGIEAQHFVKRRIKLLFFPKRELYSLYNVS